MTDKVFIPAIPPANSGPPWAIDVGAAGTVLTSNGETALPTFQAASPGGVTQTASTFNASWNGFNAAVQNTWSYVVTGSMVTLMPQAAATGTSNATTFAAAAATLPAAIRPARSVTFENVTSTDNGTASGVGAVTFNADGSIQLARAITSGVPDNASWTAAGTKAAFNGYLKAFTYPLN